jgi:orotidine-5'-phosphate decarboxylase
VGIDPVYERLPAGLREDRDPGDESAAEALVEFGRRIIRAVAPLVPVVKINSAFFERYGGHGVRGYYELVREAAHQELIVIGDVKRGDVGHSAEQYARACLAGPVGGEAKGRATPDAITVNPYFGWDGVRPFIDVARQQQKGVFLLVRTSNPSAGEFQHLATDSGPTVADHVAGRLQAWASQAGLLGESGYSCVGAVVSTRDIEEARRLRTQLERSIFLIPGYGAQGMGLDAVAALFNKDGTGAVVNASRSIIYAYQGADPEEAAAQRWEHAVERACKKSIQELADRLAQI